MKCKVCGSEKIQTTITIRKSIQGTVEDNIHITQNQFNSDDFNYDYNCKSCGYRRDKLGDVAVNDEDYIITVFEDKWIVLDDDGGVGFFYHDPRESAVMCRREEKVVEDILSYIDNLRDIAPIHLELAPEWVWDAFDSILNYVLDVEDLKEMIEVLQFLEKNAPEHTQYMLKTMTLQAERIVKDFGRKENG